MEKPKKLVNKLKANKLKTCKTNNKGITLIALVITIIVLLILAGVSISAITGNESAMEKANEAKTANESADELDSIKLAVVDAVARGNDGYVAADDLKTTLNGLITDTSVIEGSAPWTVTGTKTGKQYKIYANGNVKVLSGGDTIPEPEPEISYTISYDANGGTGSMSETSDTDPVVATNAFTAPSGKVFGCWNTEADGSGTSYDAGAKPGKSVTLYAQWGDPVKYAVQIYGINQDEDASGNTLGLTFGPAAGADYNNRYVTHEYEETAAGSGEYYVKIVTNIVAANGSETTSSEYLTDSSSNKVTRTTEEKNKYNINIHNMTWAEIKAVSDKTAFTDCMLCGDTKSVGLTLNSTISSGSVYNQYGDGAGMLYNTINSYYKKWNPSKNDNSSVGVDVELDNTETSYGSNARNAGGYRISHIRATLIGADKSNPTTGYAGNVNLSSSTCLYSCIESDLRNVITPKKIKYVTGTSESSYSLNNDISDAIWLFSEREMYGTGENSGNTTEGLGTSGVGYDKFGNTKSKYYMSYSNTNDTGIRNVYPESNIYRSLWFRSPDLSCTFRANYDSCYTYNKSSLTSSIANTDSRFKLWFLYQIVPS